MFNKKSQCIQRKSKIQPIQRKRKSTETVPEKDLVVALVDENFKTIILQMIKEL